MKNIINVSAIFLILIALGGCRNKIISQNDENTEMSEAMNKRGDGEQEKSAFNIVKLQLKQLDVMNIETGSIKQLDLGATLKVNGQLELPPQKMASVSALLGGRVQNVAVIEGDYVKKGQVIAQLDNPDFINMQREYLSAKSNIRLQTY